jgi:hypothetical protein
MIRSSMPSRRETLSAALPFILAGLLSPPATGAPAPTKPVRRTTPTSKKPVAAPVKAAIVASHAATTTPPPASTTTDTAVAEARIRALEETIAHLQQRLDQPDKDARIAALEATVRALEQKLQHLTTISGVRKGGLPAVPTATSVAGIASGGTPTAGIPPAGHATAGTPGAGSVAESPAGPEIAQAEEPAPVPPPADTETPTPETPSPAARPGATLLPNISGLGNVIFRGGPKGTEERSRFSTHEVELAFQDRVAPNLRADFFLSAEKEADWTTEVEEGYLTWQNPFGLKNLSAKFGKVRTPFGKLNPLHPHQWRFVDQPSVISAFLGPDGLNSDGAMLQYLIPIRSVFANLELGAWQTRSEAEDGLGFGGTGSDAFSSRLWIGKEVGRDRELEIGVSRYQGRGTPEGLDSRRRLAINGVDLTYRAYGAGGYKRFVVQGEAIQHHTSGPGRDRDRWGGYLDIAYRPSRYYEGGIRGDSTRLPFPVDGQESAISAYVTRFLTEQTSMRLQVRHGSRPEKSGFTEVFLQFLFGFGPHFHLLQ